MFVIFNPASGRGRGEERQRAYIELLKEAGVEFEYAATQGPGQERELAAKAISDGATTIVAVGGDGTWSNVAGCLVASGRTDVSLGLLPAGSGNDFAKNFGVTYRDPAAAVGAIARGRTRSVDVGRIRFPDEDTPARHFLLETSFGIGPAVLQAAKGTRFLKGDLLYSVTAILQIFRFKGVLAALGLDALACEQEITAAVQAQQQGIDDVHAVAGNEAAHEVARVLERGGV